MLSRRARGRHLAVRAPRHPIRTAMTVVIHLLNITASAKRQLLRAVAAKKVHLTSAVAAVTLVLLAVSMVPITSNLGGVAIAHSTGNGVRSVLNAYEDSHRIGYSHVWRQTRSGRWKYSRRAACHPGRYRAAGNGANVVSCSGTWKSNGRSFAPAVQRSRGHCAPPNHYEGLIIARESGGVVGIPNRGGSGAQGLGQLMPGNRARYQRGSGYCAELRAMRGYIRDRYGSARAAWAFWSRHRWY